MSPRRAPRPRKRRRARAGWRSGSARPRSSCDGPRRSSTRSNCASTRRARKPSGCTRSSSEVEQGLEEAAQRLDELEQRCAEESRRATLAAQDREFAEERLEGATTRLSELTAAYQALVRGIPIPVIACDAAGTVTAWNAAAERLFGWSAEDAIGRFNPSVADDQRDDYRRELRARIESGATREIEVSGRLTRAGARVDLKLSCVPLVGTSGEALGEVASVLAARPARATVEALA